MRWLWLALLAPLAHADEVYVCVGGTNDKLWSLCPTVSTATVKQPNDLVNYCRSTVTAGATTCPAASTVQQKNQYMPAYGWTLTKNRGYQRYSDVVFSPVTPPPPPPPTGPTITAFTATPDIGTIPYDVTLKWASTGTSACYMPTVAGDLPISGTWILPAGWGVAGTYVFGVFCYRVNSDGTRDTAVKTASVAVQLPPRPFVGVCKKTDIVQRIDVPPGVSLGDRYNQYGIFVCQYNGARRIEGHFGKFTTLPADLSILSTPFGTDVTTPAENAWGVTQKQAWLAAHP